MLFFAVTPSTIWFILISYLAAGLTKTYPLGTHVQTIADQMMRYLTILSLAVTLTGCERPATQAEVRSERIEVRDPSNSEIETLARRDEDDEMRDDAALNHLERRHPELARLAAPDACDADRADAQRIIVVERQRVAALRKPEWRKAFTMWLDYYQRAIDEGREEIRTRAAQRRILHADPIA